MRVLGFLLGCALTAGAQGWTGHQVAAAFAPYDHVLLVQEAGRPTDRWEGRLKATEAFQPCSTFKLPHALVALETGVITLEHSQKTCVPGECHADHGTVDLAAAIRQSCVSYFRQTARAIGPARMAAGLATLGYSATGNLEPLDGFWLSGGMRITADQQLQWIRRFYTEALPVRTEHLAAVRAATLRGPGYGFTLQGKTGASREGFGWFVGQITRQQRTSWVVVLLRGRGATGSVAERRLRNLLAQIP